jgi:hypothetical protein
MRRFTAILGILLLAGTSGLAAPKIVCEASEFNFGVRRDDETVVHQFVLKNEGDAPLAITRVKASCGCTAVKSSASSIPPGESATIDARFTLRGRRGKQQKSIMVESNDPQNPRLRLWLKGEIVVEVALEPRYVNFRQMHKDSVATQTVELVSLRPHVRIINIKTDTTAYEATIDPDGRGLTVRTVPPLKEGLVRGRIVVTTDHPKGLTTDLNIAGVAVGDLTLLPRELILRKSWPDARRLTLVVRPFNKIAFEIKKVEVPLPSIKPTSKKQPDGTARIELADVRPDPALNGKQIVIHTSLPSCPTLRVPIRVLP